jgi:hypothetical protein
MYRLFLLALCLILAGCNSEDSSGSGAAVAQINAAAPRALQVQSPPIVESPSQDSLAPPVVESPSAYSVVDDVQMEPSDEPPLAPEVSPSDKSRFPVIIFSYLFEYFDRYHRERSADDMAHFYRAQVYFAFADRLRAWFAVQDDQVLRQHLAAEYIHLERGFIDDGIVAGDGPDSFDSFLDYLDWVHGLGRTIIFGHNDDFMSAQEFDYALAAYFLVREDKDMFGINDASRTLPGNWDSRLDLDLGAPLGPRTDNGGFYTRNFECGSVTVWGPPERLGQITQTACE